MSKIKIVFRKNDGCEERAGKKKWKRVVMVGGWGRKWREKADKLLLHLTYSLLSAQCQIIATLHADPANNAKPIRKKE